MLGDLRVKYLVFLSEFNEAWVFVDKFSKNTQPDFMKIRLVGAEFYADGRADMMKPTVAFRSSANAPADYLQTPLTTDLRYYVLSRALQVQENL